MTRRTLLVLVLAVLWLVIDIHAQAPAQFKEGVLAFEKGEWAKAETLMRETIAVNPRETSGTVSIAGSWYETYVPHYFLARALAKQGKCGEALQSFRETEQQGVTPAIPDFARHLRTRGGCKPAAKEPPPKVIGEVEVPFEDVPNPRRNAGVPVAGPAASAPPRTAPASVPERPRETPGAGTGVANVETRARLTTGIRAYLEGRYEVAVRVLDEKPFSDRAAAAEAALFRAAARDAIHRIGGETDDALRAAVQTDLRIYRELRAKRKPDPRIFSPRFIAMAEQ